MPSEEGPSSLPTDSQGGQGDAGVFSISVPDHETPTEGSSGPSTPNTKSGIFGTSSNLVNSIVGAGIIGIPYAFKQSGLVAGVLLLIIVAYMTGKITAAMTLLTMLASFFCIHMFL